MQITECTDDLLQLRVRYSVSKDGSENKFGLRKILQRYFFLGSAHNDSTIFIEDQNTCRLINWNLEKNYSPMKRHYKDQRKKLLRSFRNSSKKIIRWPSLLRMLWKISELNSWFCNEWKQHEKTGEWKKLPKNDSKSDGSEKSVFSALKYTGRRVSDLWICKRSKRPSNLVLCHYTWVGLLLIINICCFCCWKLLILSISEKSKYKK